MVGSSCSLTGNQGAWHAAQDGVRAFLKYYGVFADRICRSLIIIMKQQKAFTAAGQGSCFPVLAEILVASIDYIRPSFPRNGIAQRFRELAPQYGFVERYTADKQRFTGIAPEEWHFRYVGPAHAAVMIARGLCLEEYVQSGREGT